MSGDGDGDAKEGGGESLSQGPVSPRPSGGKRMGGKSTAEVHPSPSQNKQNPTACSALFSARTTPQPSQNLVQPSKNPGKTLLELWRNPCRTLPQGRPGPPRSLSAETPKLSAAGKKSRAAWRRPSRRSSWLWGPGKGMTGTPLEPGCDT